MTRNARFAAIAIAGLIIGIPFYSVLVPSFCSHDYVIYPFWERLPADFTVDGVTYSPLLEHGNMAAMLWLGPLFGIPSALFLLWIARKSALNNFLSALIFLTCVFVPIPFLEFLTKETISRTVADGLFLLGFFETLAILDSGAAVGLWTGVRARLR